MVKWLTVITAWGSVIHLSCWHCRCETEERNTRRLEQQVALLRDTKRKADRSSMALQADVHRSMTELQEMHQEFEVTRRTPNVWYEISFYALLFFFLCQPPLSACLNVPSFFSLPMHYTFCQNQRIFPHDPLAFASECGAGGGKMRVFGSGLAL